MLGCGEGPSCSHQHGPKDSHQEYGDDFDDPTMMSCCRRDIQQRRYGTQLRARLLAVDPSQKRLKQTEQAVLRTGLLSDWQLLDSDQEAAGLRRWSGTQGQGQCSSLPTYECVQTILRSSRGQQGSPAPVCFTAV